MTTRIQTPCGNCDRIRRDGDNVEPFNYVDGKIVKGTDCPSCFSYWTNAEINRARGGDGRVLKVRKILPKPPEAGLCRFRSLEVVDHKPCVTCTGKDGQIVELHRCSRFDEQCYTGTNHVRGMRPCLRCTVPIAERIASPSLPAPPAGSSVPVKMVMPSERRPVYRGGIIQIWVTRACDRSCFGCTQGSNLGGKLEMMDSLQFRAALESLRDYWGVVAVFGGNPTLNPHFEEMCRDMRAAIPWEQRGLWSNHPKGKGATCRITFNPAYSNLNVHQSQEAYDEFARDWPECKPYLKGLDADSRHTPPYVAIQDVIEDESERWKLIGNCEVNRYWSAMIGVFRGQLRAWFCEIAGAQSMLHQDEPDYPDTGVPVVPGWWKQPQEKFAHQIRKHCMECGIPLKGHGELANNPDGIEQVSATHQGIYTPKRPGRRVQVVTDLIQLGKPLGRATNYIENSKV